MAIEWSQVLATIINFIILFFLLKHFFWDKLKACITERQELLNKQVAVTEKNLAQAEAYRIENENILKTASAEGKKIVEIKKKQADKVYSETMEEVKTDSAIMKERALMEIEREKEKAQHELKKECMDLAVSLSKKVLDENLDDEKQSEILDSLIAKVGV